MLYNEILNNLLDNEEKLIGRKVIVFGTGKAGKLTLALLNHFFYDVYAIVDNDEKKWGEFINHFEICPPKVIEKIASEEVIILVASMYYNEISQQLKEMGLNEYQNYLPASNKFLELSNKDYECKIINGVKVGKYTYGYTKLICQGTPLEEIGSFCSINETARVVTNHPIDYITTHPFLYYSKDQPFGFEGISGILDQEEIKQLNVEINQSNKPIIIRNDVWIGANVIILPGVTIGNGAIIGAGSVVTKDIPDYAVVVGVPARVLKYRFSDSEIKRLNEIKWWDWSIDKIKEHYKNFVNKDLFLKLDQ